MQLVKRTSSKKASQPETVKGKALNKPMSGVQVIDRSVVHHANCVSRSSKTSVADRKGLDSAIKQSGAKMTRYIIESAASNRWPSKG